MESSVKNEIHEECGVLGIYSPTPSDIAMCCTVDKSDADRAVAILRDAGEDAYVMGEIVRGDEGVILC